MKAANLEIGVMITPGGDANPFATAAAHGFQCVQIQNWDIKSLTPEFAEKTAKQAGDAGVRISAFWAGYSGRIVWNSAAGPATCGLVPRDLRARRIGELKRGADTAKQIGAPAVVTHCGFIPENPGDPLYAETLNAVYDVARHCQSLGLGFWFEAGQETPLTLLRAIEDLGLPNLGINLDTANLILYGRGNPVDALKVFGSHVRSLHLKDGLFPEHGNVLGREVPIGEGDVDFELVAKMLLRRKFTGDLIIEREISGAQQLADIISGADRIRNFFDRARA